MTTHWGNEGIAMVGTTAISEVQEFEVNEEVDPIDDTAMGDTWDTHIPNSGRKKWSGSITCSFDKSDTNGQEAMAVGASVSLKLYPAGNASSSLELAGTATITSVAFGTPKDDKVTRTFQILGNGALAHNTVA